MFKRWFRREMLCCTAQRGRGDLGENTFLSMTSMAPSHPEDSIISNISNTSTEQNTLTLNGSSLGLRRPTASQVFMDINKKKDGMLTFAEFLAYLETKKVEIERPVAKKIFAMFDHSETGYLTLMEFAKICPSDGNFTRAVEASIQRLKKHRPKKKKKKRDKKKKPKDLSNTTIKDPPNLGHDYRPTRKFVYNEEEDEDDQKRQPPEPTPRGNALDVNEEDWMSDESEPELHALYARSTLRTSMHTARNPERRNSLRSSISEVSEKVQVKGYEPVDEESDFDSPRAPSGYLPYNKPPIAKKWQPPPSPLAQRPRKEKLVAWGRHERHEATSTRSEPQPRSHGTSNGSNTLAYARSPDTTPPAVEYPKFRPKVPELAIRIDYGPLEEGTELYVPADSDMHYVKEHIAQIKKTPAKPIRIRFMGRVVTKAHESLEELGLIQNSVLRVDLAGGDPLDEANRVFKKYIEGKYMPPVSSLSKDHEAYLCHTWESRDAAESIRRGMEQRGWAFHVPELGKLSPADIKSVPSELGRCHLFLLFITREVATDPWALLQLLLARHRGIPICVVFETDPKRGGFVGKASLENALPKLLPESASQSALAWSASGVYQRFEVFDQLSTVLASVKRPSTPNSTAQSDYSDNPFKFNAFVPEPSQPHPSSLPPPSHLATHLSSTNRSTTGSPPRAFSDQLPSYRQTNFPVGPRGASADDEKKERVSYRKPKFTPTTNRLVTYRTIARKGMNQFNSAEMNDYLQKQGVDLTADELNSLWTTIATKRKDVITITEFIKYCPPKGNFAEKVWDTYRPTDYTSLP